MSIWSIPLSALFCKNVYLRLTSGMTGTTILIIKNIIFFSWKIRQLSNTSWPGNYITTRRISWKPKYSASRQKSLIGFPNFQKIWCLWTYSTLFIFDKYIFDEPCSSTALPSFLRRKTKVQTPLPNYCNNYIYIYITISFIILLFVGWGGGGVKVKYQD